MGIWRRRHRSQTWLRKSLQAFLACRLVPLDKQPGLRPIGFGEVLIRISTKVVMSVWWKKLQLGYIYTLYSVDKITQCNWDEPNKLIQIIKLRLGTFLLMFLSNFHGNASWVILVYQSYNKKKKASKHKIVNNLLLGNRYYYYGPFVSDIFFGIENF